MKFRIKENDKKENLRLSSLFIKLNLYVYKALTMVFACCITIEESRM